MLLNDRTTFASVEGSTIVAVPDDADLAAIEQTINSDADDTVCTFDVNAGAEIVVTATGAVAPVFQFSDLHPSLRRLLSTPSRAEDEAHQAIDRKPTALEFLVDGNGSCVQALIDQPEGQLRITLDDRGLGISVFTTEGTTTYVRPYWMIAMLLDQQGHL
jgi:hypothetical protein